MGSRDPSSGCQPCMVSTFTHGAISSATVFLLHGGDASEAPAVRVLASRTYLMSD